MPRPGGQLERSLHALTIGVALGQKARHKALTDSRTGHYVQQQHVPISGVANVGWAFTDHTFSWELPFLYAPVQSRAAFGTPHFNYGMELLGATDTLIVLNAHVIAWNVTPENWYQGATVRLAVCAPEAAAAVPYSAIAHLTFDGYATLAEGDEFA